MAQDPDPDPDPEPTATQTPDWVPLFSTPTPAPTKNYACPEDGEIEGWLTVTPSGEWLYRCSECIPRPTSSFWATKTPIPIDGTKLPTIAAQHTQTAQALTETAQALTETPEVTPTKGPEAYTRQWDWTEVSCPTGYCPRYMEGNLVTVEDRENLVATMWLWTTSIVNDRDNIYPSVGIFINDNTDIWYFKHGTYTDAGTHEYIGCRIIYQQKDRKNNTLMSYIEELALINGCELEEELDGKPEAVPQTYQAVLSIMQREQYTAINSKFLGIGIYYGIEPETPTPEPPPSECDAVNGLEGTIVGGYKEDWLILPKMMQRSAGCTQIGGWSISTGWVGNITEMVGISVPEVLQIPGLNICWQEIQFGEVDLFRIKISLDVIAGLMAGIAMIRIFR